MKKLIVCIVLFTVFNLNAQNITIQKSSNINADGIIETSEWASADSVLIEISGSTPVTVKYKHDGTNLLFAFINLPGGMNTGFPEINIDVKNDKTENWSSDDYWFHVSATDCFAIGKPSDYANCKTVQPNWLAAPNFENGKPFPKAVEIQIPFSTLNFALDNKGKAIGICFDVSNTATYWEHWPAKATYKKPASWATAIIK